LRAESTAAESAEEVGSGLQDILEADEPRPLARWRLQQGPAFWRDGNLQVKLRSYDFERDDGSDTLSEAFTLGGELSFRSGKWNEILSVDATWYTSQGIDAPAGRDGTGLLGPGQTDISVLGQASVRLNFEQILLRVYRQDLNLPYLNRHDIRMLPNTHEGVVVARAGDVGQIGFAAGHITKMKTRTSEDFVPMAEIAGVPGGDSGTTLLGARYNVSADLDIGAIAFHTSDLFDTVYVEANWRRTLPRDWGLQVSAQFTDQKSIGRELLNSFSTSTWGARAVASYRNAVLTLARTETDEGAAIRSPFGGKPSYNSLMILDFDRAGERAQRFGLSYNFRRLGLPSLSLQFNVARGEGALDAATGLRLPDDAEKDLTLDYRPAAGVLEGLWVRLRVAEADRMSASADRNDVRLIVNYELPVF